MEPVLAALAGPGGGAAILASVSSEEKLCLMLASPAGLWSAESNAGRGELQSLALEFRRLVSDPQRDPRAAGKALYELVVKPLEGPLKESGAGTLLLWLDAPLDDAPLAALWDGTAWIVERIPVAVFSPESVRRIVASPDGGESPEDASDGKGAAAGKGGSGASKGDAPKGAEARAVPGGKGGAGGSAAQDGAPAAPGLDVLERALAAATAPAYVEAVFRAGDGEGDEGAADAARPSGTVTLNGMVSGEGAELGSVDVMALSPSDPGSVPASAPAGIDPGPRVPHDIIEALLVTGVRAVLEAVMPAESCRKTGGVVSEFSRFRYGEGKGRADALREAQLSVMRGTTVPPAADVSATGADDTTPPDAESGDQAQTEAGTQEPPATGSQPEAEAGGQAPPAEAGQATGVPVLEAKDSSHPCFWAPYVLEGDWR
jgi:hypothetical protein